MRLKDRKHTYNDHRDVDLRIGGDHQLDRKPGGAGGILGGSVGLLIWFNLPEEWISVGSATGSGLCFLLFHAAFILGGTAMGRFIAKNR